MVKGEGNILLWIGALCLIAERPNFMVTLMADQPRPSYPVGYDRDDVALLCIGIKGRVRVTRFINNILYYNNTDNNRKRIYAPEA
jgi:hypothetical protein